MQKDTLEKKKKKKKGQVLQFISQLGWFGSAERWQRSVEAEILKSLDLCCKQHLSEQG